MRWVTMRMRMLGYFFIRSAMALSSCSVLPLPQGARTTVNGCNSKSQGGHTRESWWTMTSSNSVEGPISLILQWVKDLLLFLFPLSFSFCKLFFFFGSSSLDFEEGVRFCVF